MAGVSIVEPETCKLISYAVTFLVGYAFHMLQPVGSDFLTDL